MRSQTWLAPCSSIRLSLFKPDSSHSVQSEAAPPHADSDPSTLASDALAGGDKSVLEWTTLAAPATGGHDVSGRGNCFSPTPRAPGVVGLAHEWYNLNTAGLPHNAIKTIQSARALSTRFLEESSMIEMSHQTILVVGVKQEEVIISNDAALWCKLLKG